MKFMDRPLTTLELTVLGVVLKRGPCVAHAVVNEFSNSQTLAYRSGAGSIYPLLKRLHEAGLVEYDGKQYTISEAGIQEMRRWIMPPHEFSTNLDDLRSRIYFLRLLSPSEVQIFFENVLKELESLLERCRKDQEGYQRLGDPFSSLAILGAVRETEARIAWVNEIREAFLSL